MGSTQALIVCMTVPRDHPHIHGEHSKIGPAILLKQGSPPYTWGAHKARTIRPTGFGITPIYMGSTQVPVPRA